MPRPWQHRSDEAGVGRINRALSATLHGFPERETFRQMETRYDRIAGNDAAYFTIDASHR